MVKQFIKRIIILNIIFELIMMIYRIIFVSYYSNWVDLCQYSFKSLLKAFAFGVINDYSIFAYINFLVILFFLIVWFIDNQKFFINFVKSLKYYYTIQIGLILILLYIDFIFYFYFHVHTDYKIFDIFNYSISELYYFSLNKQMLFLIAFVILVFMVVFVFKISRYVLEKNFYSQKIESNIMFKVVVILLLCLYCFKGFSITYDEHMEFKFKEIATFGEKKQLYYFIVTLSDSPIHKIYNILNDKIKEQKWNKKITANGIRQNFADYLYVDVDSIDKDSPQNSLLKTTKYNKNIENIEPNVILIVMESLGMDLLKYNSEYFDILGELKKHFDEDIVFYNCLYSYENTIPSLQLIFNGVFRSPYISTIDFPVYSKTFAQNAYRNNDYLFYCFYRFEVNLNTDYENLASREDGDTMNKTFEILKKNDRKKFIFIMTQTAHYPFLLPKNYEPKKYDSIPNDLKNIDVDLFNAQQYSCQKVGEFLTKLKESKYADNTIVAIVGDHYSRINPNMDILTLKSVPLYFYIPKKLKPNKNLIDTSRIVSQLDIMPTLYELSLSNVTYLAMGTSVFDKDYQNAISSNYNNAVIVNGNDMCTYDINLNKIYGYKIIRKEKELAKCESAETTDKHKKMIKQYEAAVAVSQYLMKEVEESKND